MKCAVFICTIFMVSTVSCAQTPTAVPSVALLTATPRFETAAPIVTNTTTTTPTPRPTTTATQTPTPRPKSLVFTADFNDTPIGPFKGEPSRWAGYHSDGVTMNIVPDPLGSRDSSGNPRGNVLKVTIKGEPAQNLETGSTLWWRSGSPTWWNGNPKQTLAAPAVIQVDITKSPELFGSILGFHRLNKKTGDNISVAALEAGPNDVITLLARDGQGKDTRYKLKPNLFDSRKWNTVAIELRPDGSVIPWINGQNAYVQPQYPLTVPVDADHDPGFMDAHAGYLISNPNKNDGIQEGLWLMNDNFLVFTYQ